MTVTEAPVNPPVDDNDDDEISDLDVTHFEEDDNDAETLIGEPVAYDLGSDDDD